MRRTQSILSTIRQPVPQSPSKSYLWWYIRSDLRWKYELRFRSYNISNFSLREAKSCILQHLVVRQTDIAFEVDYPLNRTHGINQENQDARISKLQDQLNHTPQSIYQQIITPSSQRIMSKRAAEIYSCFKEHKLAEPWTNVSIWLHKISIPARKTVVSSTVNNVN